VDARDTDLASPDDATGLVGRARAIVTHRSFPVLAAATLYCFWAVLFPLTNTDIWWHLAAGRHMIESGGFVHEDPFSYVTAGAKWVDVHWSFQLFTYAVHGLFGVAGLVLAKALVFAVACAILLVHSHRRETAPVAAALMVAVAYFVRFLILVRPIVFTLLFVAAFLLVLARYRRERSWHVLVALPIIQVVWANTQGLHALGPALVVCFLAGEGLQTALARVRSRAIAFEDPLPARALVPVAYTFLGLCVASAVSPYGLSGALLPWKLYARVEPALSALYSWNVSENMPTWAIMRRSPEQAAHVVWFTVGALATFVLSRRRTSLFRLLLFGAFLYLGLQAKRNLSLYLFVLVPVTVGNLNAWLDERTARRGPEREDAYAKRFGSATLLAAAAVGVVFVALLVAAQLREPSVTGLAPFRVPVAATRALERERPRGNIFNSVRHGGYLIWRLYPRHQVHIDGRLVIRTPRQFGEYLATLDEPAGFEAVRERWNITHAVLPTAVFHRYLPLVRRLYRDARWSLRFADGSSALFVFSPMGSVGDVDLASVDEVKRIAAELDSRHADHPGVREAARLHLAGLLLYLELYGGVDEALRDVDSLDARRYLAQCRYLQRRRDEAMAICREVLAAAPGDATCLNLSGRIHMEAGRVREALSCFREVLSRDPYDETARRALEKLERNR